MKEEQMQNFGDMGLVFTGLMVSLGALAVIISFFLLLSGGIWKNKGVFEGGIWMAIIASGLFVIGGIFGTCFCIAAILVIPGLFVIKKKIFPPSPTPPVPPVPPPAPHP